MTPIKHRVLVTGFGPFRQHTENPSWLAVRTLHDTLVEIPAAPAPAHPHRPHAPPPAPAYAHITALEVPVVYDAVLSIVPGIHAAPPVLSPDLPAAFPPPPEAGYDLIVHVGVGSAGPLRLETFGDKTGYDLRDHEGTLADVVTLDDGEGLQTRGFAGKRYARLPERLQILVDPDLLRARCEKDGVDLRPSTDAGHYLCDFILYCSLAESQLSRSKVPVLFVHCPPVNEPLSTEEVAEGLKSIIVNALAMSTEKR
ncbi:hypothetical protein HDZ31DRAFT_81784 [Schizophyllum fasciatum]